MLEKLILAEIQSKKLAIHAYDGIVWKIRSGFLTLVFGGWAILLHGLVGETKLDAGVFQPLVWALYLFSLGFTLGAWYVDRSYVRRKFRVIVAVGDLIDSIHSCAEDYRRIPVRLLKIAGDSSDMPYRCQGYGEAIRTELSIYWVPPVIILAALVLVL